MRNAMVMQFEYFDGHRHFSFTGDQGRGVRKWQRQVSYDPILLQDKQRLKLLSHCAPAAIDLPCHTLE